MQAGRLMLGAVALVAALVGDPLGANAQFFDFFSPAPAESAKRKARPVDGATRARSKPAAIQQPAHPPEGLVQIVVSIPDQRLKVYADGIEHASAPVSTGKPGHATPKGVFSVLQKRRFHRSNIYSGAPMPFMQRLTWSGIALHAGALPGYPASHGCIRMPHVFADQMFRWTTPGARVIVTDALIAPLALAHANLPTYRLPILTAKGPLVLPVVADAEAFMAALGPVGPQPAGAARDAGDRPATSGAESTKETSQEPAEEIAEDEPSPLERALAKRQPVSVFVSRKTGKVYVRQGYEPLLTLDVGIADRDRAIGTHVLTVMARDAETQELRWSAFTLPTDSARPQRVVEVRGRAADASTLGFPSGSAADALDRVIWPEELLALVGPLLVPGSSILISDQGLGRETGKHTDFIVLTP